MSNGRKLAHVDQPDDSDRWALRLIASGGWALTRVFDADPPFSYTTGLTEFAHPELIIYGNMRPEFHAAILNDLGVRVAAGRRFLPGDMLDDVLRNGPITFVAVDEPSVLGQSVALYGRGFSALQVVWPDGENRFPWQPGYPFPAHVQPVTGPHA
jgi:hypothetical protein